MPEFADGLFWLRWKIEPQPPIGFSTLVAFVPVVGVAELVLRRAQEPDDPTARGVADRLAAAVGT